MTFLNPILVFLSFTHSWRMMAAVHVPYCACTYWYYAQYRTLTCTFCWLQSLDNQGWTVVFLKRSHCCLFCPSRAGHARSKEEVISTKVSPKHLNKAFSTKPTEYICGKQHGKSNGTRFSTHMALPWGGANYAGSWAGSKGQISPFMLLW